MFYPSMMNDREQLTQREFREYVREEVPHDLVRAMGRKD